MSQNLSLNSVAFTSESVPFYTEDSTSFWASFKIEAKPKSCYTTEFEIFGNAFIFFTSCPEGWKIKAIELFNTQTNCFFSLPSGLRQRKRSSNLYDPILARMLNADPFVANPTSAQDYNRYSYVRNNPLKYTDPSGYLPKWWGRRRNVPMFDGGGTYRSRRMWGVSFGSGSQDISDEERFMGYYCHSGILGHELGHSFGGQSAASSGFSGNAFAEGYSPPKFLIKFPDMVDFRRGIFGGTHWKPWHWGIRKATIPVNLGWNYSVSNAPNQNAPNFTYNNNNWFQIIISWPTSPGIVVSGTLNGQPANAFVTIRGDGIALDAFGRPVDGVNAEFSNGANLAFNLPPGTIYDVRITTRSRRIINMPFPFVDFGLGFWKLIFGY